MLTKLRASGRFSNPLGSLGRASGSVLAFLIFEAIVSALSVILIRLLSDGSDFDIFFDPSLSDITRVAAPSIIGSGNGNKSVSKS